MATFTTLSQPDEDDLHAKRLLNIEEKPYRRVQKRLLAPTNPIQQYLRRATTTASASNENVTSDHDVEAESPSDGEIPNGNHAAAAPKSEEEVEQYLASLTSFTHQTLHDFSALNTSLARLQFLLDANDSERKRYTSQSSTITSQHEQITSETSALRSRLDEARARLEQRKVYDELAKKVLYVNGKDGTRAKTREELGRESERLRSEIEELEREGEELKVSWRERREGLVRVSDEAARLRRIVRGEPEHEPAETGAAEGDDNDSRSDDADGEDAAEKRRDEDEHQNHHGSDDHHDHDHDQEQGDDMLGAGDRDAGVTSSNVGTPRPLLDDDAPTPNPATGHASADMRGMTPASVGEHDDGGIGGDGGAVTPRLSGSGLKQEMRFDGIMSGNGSEVGGDIAMADQQQPPTSVVDVPEVRIEDGDKMEIGRMDLS